MATVRPAPTLNQDILCPACGMRQSLGGCTDPRLCMAALPPAELNGVQEFARGLERRDANQMDSLSRAGLEALDILGIGFVVCDATARMISLNSTANELLQTADGLHLTAGGELCATQTSAPSFKEAVAVVAEAAQSGNIEKQNLALALPRRSGRRALTIYLRGLAAPDQQEPPSVAVLVMILDSTVQVKTEESDLNQLFGFTASEARLANLLMEGKTLEACCDELEIQRSTGCSHMKRIFKKTGVHRQSDLVSLLLKSIGLLRVQKPSSIYGGVVIPGGTRPTSNPPTRLQSLNPA